MCSIANLSDRFTWRDLANLGNNGRTSVLAGYDIDKESEKLAALFKQYCVWLVYLAFRAFYLFSRLKSVMRSSSEARLLGYRPHTNLA